MKKYMGIVLGVILVVIAVCASVGFIMRHEMESSDVIKPYEKYDRTKTVYNINEVLDADSRYCEMKFGIKPEFYTSTITFNGYMDEVSSKNIGVIEMYNMFQCGDTCVVVVHLQSSSNKSKPTYEYYGDKVVGMDPIDLPLPLSVKDMRDMCVCPPHTNRCVIKKERGEVVYELANDKAGKTYVMMSSGKRVMVVF